MKYEPSLARHGKSLTAIVDLWPLVADALGVTLSQAATFVEDHFFDLGLVLYNKNEYTGLWHPVTGKDDQDFKRVDTYFMNVWISGEDHKWAPEEIAKWHFLRITHSGKQAILSRANRIANGAEDSDDFAIASGLGGDQMQIKTTNDPSNEDEIDPSDYPIELSAANIAFRAVRNGYGDLTATFKRRLIHFLESSYPDLRAEAVQRIATVANPDKAPGRKKRKAE